MYRVIIVDDEPTSLNHVCTIIEKKCPYIEIIGKAEDGSEAIDMIERYVPDLVITDVQMPKVDGIALVKYLWKKFPEMFTIIISGYSEFEYARKALSVGVSNYLLKPLTPTDMSEAMDQIKKKLDSIYYQKRNQILRALCNNEKIDLFILTKYFPKCKYYSAILRRNAVPRRFDRNAGYEVFSNEEENIYLYGRDEYESLYLIPEALVDESSFKDIINRLYAKSQNEQSYITLLTQSKSSELTEIYEVIGDLYNNLNEHITIGENQLLYLDQVEHTLPETRKEEATANRIEQLIRMKDSKRFFVELGNIFSIWKEQRLNQLYVEGRIEYFLQLMMSSWASEVDKNEIKYLLDDTFFEVANMDELESNIINIIEICTPTLNREVIDDKEQLFDSIILYIHSRLGEAITIHDILKEFGLSQPSLNRMFRQFLNITFSNYLMTQRVKRAKELMNENTQEYIKDIAMQVGYLDQFYFSRIFRTITGFSPRQYMDSLQEKERS